MSDLLRASTYSSHPGYGCWLSGIDVNTQLTNQTHQDPYLAVVVSTACLGLTDSQIDPNRTVSAGKVEIGAFRTYPEGYTPPSTGSSEYQSIPIDKIEDFGAHANSYYPLKVEIYKSKTDEQLLDLLWNKYWVATLSQSPILSVSPASDQRWLAACPLEVISLTPEPRVHHVPGQGSQRQAE